jgi:acetyl-CoA carboxylase biotin carboxyl carrier protein
MDTKQIKELMSAMDRWRIKRLVVKNKEGEEVQLERDFDDVKHSVYKKEDVPSYYESVVPKTTASQAERVSQDYKESADYITSPMVGTFYASPSPDEPPFIKLGDRVDADTVVCIIEAMKVMNEVKAGMSGVIREVCVENAQPVEFGTKLFRIE